MNRLAKRAWFALVLAAVLVVGMATIVVRYITQASEWVSFRSNPAVQTDGALSTYTVVARDGTEVLNTLDGVDYAEDAALRTSLLHLLGDGGNVASYVTDAYGQALTGYNAITGVYGTDDEPSQMTLTISPTVQTAAYHAMEGKKGVIGVYNYQTGEVLCMLSMPTYDPENPPESIYTTDENGNTVVKDEYDSVYFNRFLWATYTPGSTFKLVTAAAALDTIEDIESRTFTCTGSVEIEGTTVNCHNHEGHGTLTLKQALAKSCNVAFAELADELGAEILTEYAEKMGITTAISFDGLQARAGSFDLSKADDYAVAWSGIGQYEDQVNPCRLMTLVGAIANGGKAATPYVVEEVTSGGKTEYEAQTQMGERILSRDTADRLAEMMEYAVTTNYSSYGTFAGLTTGGKSGTAQRDDGTSDALYVGFSSDPDYPLAFVVIIEGGGSGSGACLPVVQQVLNACVVAMDNGA